MSQTRVVASDYWIFATFCRIKQDIADEAALVSGATRRSQRKGFKNLAILADRLSAATHRVAQLANGNDSIPVSLETARDLALKDKRSNFWRPAAQPLRQR